MAFDEGNAALRKEPAEFKQLLQLLVERAQEVASELGLSHHGAKKEDQLTAQMVYGQKKLTASLHAAHFSRAAVQHQYTLSDGRPDIVLVNVNFTNHACNRSDGNRPIVVEIKKETEAMFTIDRHKDQVKRYRKQLRMPSPYAVLLNFEKDSLGVQLMWAKYNEKDRALKWHT